jgi:hypothetical protein
MEPSPGGASVDKADEGTKLDFSWKGAGWKDIILGLIIIALIVINTNYGVRYAQEYAANLTDTKCRELLAREIGTELMPVWARANLSDLKLNLTTGTTIPEGTP